MSAGCSGSSRVRSSALLAEPARRAELRLDLAQPLLQVVGLEPGRCLERRHGICTFSIRPRIVATRPSI